jgi:phosphoribosylformylglycinamidine synthase
VAALVGAIVSGDHQPPLLSAVHDVSSGGLAVALGEMAVSAGTGCAVALDDPSELFTELPSRFVVATAMPDELCLRAENLGLSALVLGRAGGDRVVVGDLLDLPVGALREAHEGNLARLVGDS